MKAINFKSPSTSEVRSLETFRNNNSQRKETNSNSLKKKKIILIIIIPLIVIIMIIGILIYFILKIKSNKNMNMGEMERNITLYGREEDSVIPKTLTKEEIKIAKYNTVIKLNNIILPSSESNFLYNETYLGSFYKFSYNFFVDLNYTNFSPLTLYNILINIYMAISDKEQLDILNNILELNNDERIIFYSQIFQNNNFNNSKGEIKISNGAFYNSDKVEENKTYI